MQTRADGGAVMDEARAHDANGSRRDPHRADPPPASARADPPSRPRPEDPPPEAGPAESPTGSDDDGRGRAGPGGASAKQDRWRWRRRIRANPQQRFAYRVIIGVLGLVCLIAGALTGPLPGPGGIPLVLLGLAIWASEFSWAHRLLEWFKRKVHQVRRLPRGRKALFWVCFLAACGLLGYASLVTVGVPQWLPSDVDGVLARIPGVRMQ